MGQSAKHRPAKKSTSTRRTRSARADAEELPESITAPAVPRQRVAFGPDTGWSSWQWIGSELSDELSETFDTSIWRGDEAPNADVLVLIKFLPPLEQLRRIAERTAIIYCPVDRYGNCPEIDADGLSLRLCARVVVHLPALRKFFAPYCAVESLDHHVKYVRPEMCGYRRSGPVLWVGHQCNAWPLVEWHNATRPHYPLIVLTDFDESRPVSACDLGFRAAADRVTVEQWSPERHLSCLGEAKAAIDVKGSDFRQRYKPPTKAVDFIAAGLPLAINDDSSASEYLANLGFAVASLEDAERWHGRGYWEETRRFGTALRELLSRRRVAWRLRRIIDMVVSERTLPSGNEAS